MNQMDIPALVGLFVLVSGLYAFILALIITVGGLLGFYGDYDFNTYMQNTVKLLFLIVGVSLLMFVGMAFV